MMLKSFLNLSASNQTNKLSVVDAQETLTVALVTCRKIDLPNDIQNIVQ